MMVTELGMSERLGPVTLGRKQHEVFLGRDIMEDRNYSEEIAYAIDQEVRRIIDECFERVRVILTDMMDKVEEITVILLEKEVLEGPEFNRLLGFDDETKDEKKAAPADESESDEDYNEDEEEEGDEDEAEEDRD